MTDSYTLQGVFGGTFDPIHLGHVNTVQSVLKQTDLQSIVFIPAATPPLREQPKASAKHRLEMVRIATERKPNFLVDDRELKRNSPSYTIDTIASLQLENPNYRYSVILGLDAMLGLTTWYRWQELLERVHFIVMKRPGWSLPYWYRDRKVEAFDELTKTRVGKIYFIDIKPIDLSATYIRARIHRGEDVSKLLPEGILHYIKEKKLYE